MTIVKCAPIEILSARPAPLKNKAELPPPADLSPAAWHVCKLLNILPAAFKAERRLLAMKGLL